MGDVKQRRWLEEANSCHSTVIGSMASLILMDINGPPLIIFYLHLISDSLAMPKEGKPLQMRNQTVEIKITSVIRII